MSYNGWTNHETWLVNVWFNPECHADVDMAKETIDEAVEVVPPFLRDFLTTDQINWNELHSSVEEEEEEEEKLNQGEGT